MGGDSRAWGSLRNHYIWLHNLKERAGGKVCKATISDSWCLLRTTASALLLHSKSHQVPPSGNSNPGRGVLGTTDTSHRKEWSLCRVENMIQHKNQPVLGNISPVVTSTCKEHPILPVMIGTKSGALGCLWEVRKLLPKPTSSRCGRFPCLAFCHTSYSQYLHCLPFGIKIQS